MFFCKDATIFLTYKILYGFFFIYNIHILYEIIFHAGYFRSQSL